MLTERLWCTSTAALQWPPSHNDHTPMLCTPRPPATACQGQCDDSIPTCARCPDCHCLHKGGRQPQGAPGPGAALAAAQPHCANRATVARPHLAGRRCPHGCSGECCLVLLAHTHTHPSQLRCVTPRSYILTHHLQTPEQGRHHFPPKSDGRYDKRAVDDAFRLLRTGWHTMQVSLANAQGKRAPQRLKGLT